MNRPFNCRESTKKPGTMQKSTCADTRLRYKNHIDKLHIVIAVHLNIYSCSKSSHAIGKKEGKTMTLSDLQGKLGRSLSVGEKTRKL